MFLFCWVNLDIFKTIKGRREGKRQGKERYKKGGEDKYPPVTKHPFRERERKTKQIRRKKERKEKSGKLPKITRTNYKEMVED